MRITILFFVLSVLLVQTYSSPMQLSQHQMRAVAKQAASTGGVAPVSGAVTGADDEDDDDDDDDPDLGDLVDDDDDDEDDDDDTEDDDDDTPQGLQAPGGGTVSDDDEEDDDDDDDYLDRLFDDILGDDDEDDDDDTDIRPASSTVNFVPSVVPEENVSPAAQTAVVSAVADNLDQPVETANSADIPVGNTVQTEAQLSGTASNAATSNAANNEGTLAGDDDDEEADDEDDDDDDIIGDDVIEARREARESKFPTSMKMSSPKIIKRFEKL